MSLLENPFCQLCQVAFDSVGDLSLHSCADIKQEIQDYELPTNVKLSVDFEKHKAIETGTLLSIEGIKNYFQQFNFLERFYELIKKSFRCAKIRDL
jgi:hypothetical protein